jgi:hypothetical protein
MSILNYFLLRRPVSMSRPPIKRANALLADAGSISGTFVASLPKAVAAQAVTTSSRPQDFNDVAAAHLASFLHIALDPF